MPISFDYSGKYDNVFNLANNAKEVLELLHKGVEERRFITLPTNNNMRDTCTSSLSDGPLYVLKTYQILGPDQPYVNMTIKQQNDILSQNLNSAQEQLKKMEDRAKDDYYHIMVAGDVNSGKSAFINGLLRRDILPSGGRSLTSTFVEVLDAQDLDGSEAVHLCRRGVEYDRENEDTFEREDIDNLYDIMCDWSKKEYNTMYDTIKLYIDYRRIDNNFLNNIERKVHIIDSVGLNTSADETRFLFKKQQEIDVLILIIDARNGLTESSTNIMRSYCEKRTQLFVIITHFDGVCICKKGKCYRSCKEDCKQKIMDIIKRISPKTVESANELIHCVNPTLVPMWDDESGGVVGEMPPEWAYMEAYLHIFIYDQFDFHKLSPIKNYLQKLMHDAILISKLNLDTLEPKLNEKEMEINQLKDDIGQLENRYDEAYIKARDIIIATINNIHSNVLRIVNDLKNHPERFFNREMIELINSKATEGELQRLLQEKWNEFEEWCKHAIDMCIQDCTSEIEKLVEGLPKDSTDVCFTSIKLILQDVNFDASGIRETEQSLKYKVEEMAQKVLSGSVKNSKRTWRDFMCQTLIDKINKYSKDGLKLIMDNSGKMDSSSDERQGFGQKTPFDDLEDLLSAMRRSKMNFKLTGRVTDAFGSICSIACITIACVECTTGIPVEVISLAGIAAGKIVAEIWKYIEEHLRSTSSDEMYETVKEIIREVLSKENFSEDYANQIVRIAEEQLFSLLDNQIGNCYAAKMTEQINQFIECCEEIESLNEGKELFQQLNEKATQVQTSMEELQL